MWYEILPAAIIIVAAISFPTYVTMGISWLALKGHPYRRSLDTTYQRRMYLRDVDRFGSTYNFRGLEEFFDEVDKQKGKKCVCEDE